jgi:hypothetical protein
MLNVNPDWERYDIAPTKANLQRFKLMFTQSDYDPFLPYGVITENLKIGFLKTL